MDDFRNWKGYFHNLGKDDIYSLLKYLEEYKIKYRDTLGLDKKISFGVEIEFNDVFLEDIKTILASMPQFYHYTVMEDTSVLEISNIKDVIDKKEKPLIWGGEVATEVLHDTRYDWQNLKRLCQILKDNGAIITDKCSSHIHVGSQIWGDNDLYIKRFLKVWIIFEEVIYKFSANGDSIRRGVLNYAKPLGDLKGQDDLDKCLARNRGVNTLKYRPTTREEKDNTIEIRTLNGTLDERIIQNNVGFFLNLMNYVKGPMYDDSLIDKIYTNINKIIDINNLRIDIGKALILGDLIFRETEDKLNFLNIYLKSNKPVYNRGKSRILAC